MIRSSSLEKLFSSALTQVEDVRIREQLQLILDGKDDIALPDELTDPASDEEEMDEAMAQTLAAKIKDMTIPEKIKLALLGNKVARGVLIRDTNWMVAGFVLENPKISENEIHEFARNTNLDEMVMRSISNNSSWMKSYSVKQSLVSNPKTPVDVSIKWIKHLKDRDLRNLSRSKNVPQVISTQCRKLLETRKKN